MDIILPEDLYKYIKNYDNKIYSFVKKSEYENINELENKIYEEIDDFYKVSNETDNLNIAKEIYFKDFINYHLNDKINEFKKRIENRKNIITKLNKLKDLKLPDQRSEEWYQLRNQILTASSLADAIGVGHFSTKEELLIQKCGGPKSKIPFDIVEWGVMYEPVATKFYELLNNLIILEFGLVCHPKFKIFGASPDGICDINSPDDYIGRMLEIKCPPKRKFTNEVPNHYWIQMQGQLECCDLEECDFLQVKFTEYLNELEYKNDSIIDDNKNIKNGYSSLNLPKGLLLAFITHQGNENPIIKYEYCEFYKSFEEYKEWSDKIIYEYKDKNIYYDECIYHWWKIERYECTLVGRDRKWWLETQPKIIDFWGDVEHYRKVGIEEILNKKKIKHIKLKENKKKNKNKKKSNKTIYEIDKAVVDQIENNYLLDSD